MYPFSNTSDPRLSEGCNSVGLVYKYVAKAWLLNLASPRLNRARARGTPSMYLYINIYVHVQVLTFSWPNSLAMP